MEKIGPRLDLSIDDRLKGEGQIKVELNFSQFSDFHPEAIVQQVPRLAKLLQARTQLRDLLSKLDGNDELNELLALVAIDHDELKKLAPPAESPAP